jgi:cytochrome oxidase Cu insertion factor (SCO1/SenC/PrrC family)
MNAENIGIIIAKLDNKEDDTFVPIPISIEPDKDLVKHYFEEILIPAEQKTRKCNIYHIKQRTKLLDKFFM